MTTKEKLDLLWKYLLLVILVFGFIYLGKARHAPLPGHGMGPHAKMWIDDDCDFKGMKGLEGLDMDIDIEALIDAGDSSIKVIINGEEASLEDLEDMDLDLLMGDDHKIIVKKSHKSGKGPHKKIIRMEIDSGEE